MIYSLGTFFDEEFGVCEASFSCFHVFKITSAKSYFLHDNVSMKILKPH